MLEVLVRRILFSSVFLQATLFDDSVFVVEYVTSNVFGFIFSYHNSKVTLFGLAYRAPN